MDKLASVFFVVIASLAGIQGLWVMLTGTSVMHQVLCAIYFLTMTVAVGVVILAEALAKLRPAAGERPISGYRPAQVPPPAAKP